MNDRKPYEAPRILSQDSKAGEVEIGNLLAETITIQKPEELQELADAAASTYERAKGCALAVMPDDQLERAAMVAWLRCLKDYSWRQVAGHLHMRWVSAQEQNVFDHIQQQYGWAPPTNQLFGLAMCDRAAKLLGEDPEVAPWN